MSEENENLLYTKTTEIMSRIETRQDFFEFLEIFEVAISRDQEFRALRFESGVGGMATYMFGNEDISEEPSWRVFADILYTGMLHG